MESRDGKQTNPVQTVTSGNLWTAVVFLGGLPDPGKTMGNVFFVAKLVFEADMDVYFGDNHGVKMANLKCFQNDSLHMFGGVAPGLQCSRRV